MPSPFQSPRRGFSHAPVGEGDVGRAGEAITPPSITSKGKNKAAANAAHDFGECIAGRRFAAVMANPRTAAVDGIPNKA